MPTRKVWTLALALAVSGCTETRTEIAAVDPVQPAALPVVQSASTDRQVPDFSSYRDVSRRKQAFYNFMLPKIRRANQEVMAEREWLLDIAARLVGGNSLSEAQLDHLLVLEKRYGLAPRGDVVQQVGAMLRRVDVVPASLVMAQAAKESGWGTSRFAAEGNNFFGIWCFSNGCGITPQNRDPGRTHEVATFRSVSDCVRYYIRTLNSLPAYRELRTIRANARRQHQLAPGDQLAQGLIRYSEQGLMYVKEIQSMIHYNKLHRFTLIHQEA